MVWLSSVYCSTAALLLSWSSFQISNSYFDICSSRYNHDPNSIIVMSDSKADQLLSDLIHFGPNDDKIPHGELSQESGLLSVYPLLPPAIPLAVKSPYLNAWLPTGNGRSSPGHLAGAWPRFWPISYPRTERNYKLGWSGLIRIDSNQTFVFLGDPASTPGVSGLESATQRRFEYTATRSIFGFEAAGVEFNVTFLSPITPDDLIATSLPLSDMIVEVELHSLRKHKVEVYSDISGEWASADSNAKINWDFLAHKKSGIHLVQRQEQQLFREIDQQAEWGSAIYATKMGPNTRAGTGSARNLRNEFIARGHLTGALDSHHRAINDNEPVFGFSIKLTSSSNTATFTVGHMRDPYVNYVTTSGQINRRGYWAVQYPTIPDAINGWVTNSSSLLTSSISFDKKLQNDAVRVSGHNYASIVTLSARQAFATFEITVGTDSADVMAFLKEISSNGDMSTVDVIFPLYPILTYAQPYLLKLLLEPLLRYAVSGLYPNKYPVHDLGVYPNAWGHNDGQDEPMPVEEAGNMLWMILAYYQSSKDVELIQKYYDVLKQWTEFLIVDGLVPDEQLSTDDFAGTLSNQTNLAVKAIVGIGAMGKLAAATGRWVESIHFEATAKAYASHWYDLALSAQPIDLPHAKLAYQDEYSHGLLYNLFGDRVLNLGVFDKQLYDWQSAFYVGQAREFGVPLDSRHMWTKSDWEMFASASTTDRKTRDMFVDLIVKYLKEGKVDAGFPDLYETTDGNFPGRGQDWPIEFIARPVVGGHFSLLALEVANNANGVKRDPFAGRTKERSVVQRKEEESRKARA